MPTAETATVGADDRNGWVGAAPFRAWLNHLSAATGFDPLVVAVAAKVPIGVARTLAGNGLRPKSIRAIDAMGLLGLDPGTLLSLGDTLADAAPACQALAALGAKRPTPSELQSRLGVSAGVADGLVNGWLDVCLRSVVWQVIAYTQETLRDCAQNAEPEPVDAGSLAA